MKFKKLTEQELANFDVTSFKDPGNLMDGEAEFKIVKSEEYTTKSGVSCLKWYIEFNQEGRSGKAETFEWLPNDKNMWLWSFKLKSMGYESGGKFWEYYNGNVDPDIFAGKKGKCKIAIESNEYEHNGNVVSKKIVAIKQYIKADKISHVVGAGEVKKASSDNIEDDDLPF